MNDDKKNPPIVDNELVQGAVPALYSNLTLRDFFAAFAVQALIQRHGAEGHKRSVINAELAYEAADAMMVERDKKRETK